MKGMKLLTLMLAILLALCSCTSPPGEPPEGEGFAIYLLAQDIPVSKMPIVSHLELADKPLLTLGDIVSYSRETHEIELTARACEKLLEIDVPMNGKAFVVCVDRQPVYWGAFWSYLSSVYFGGVTIYIHPPLFSDRHTIQLKLGYPSESFYSGGDPRSDPKVIRSLEQAGKLR